MARASGQFDVKLTPQAADDVTGTSIARMTIEKQFHGELEGSSKGQMLAISTAVDGSAGYVAMEKVEGKLHGRQGTFALQHIGTMNRGAQDLRIMVVPDSGTDQMTGIAGTMSITIDKDGKHFYDFEYTLPG